MTMIACYESDVLFYAGLSIGLWIASVVGMGCAMLSFRKKSYADQIEEMMFEHIVQQLRDINIADAYEQEEEQEEEEQVDSDEQEEQEQEDSDSESEQEQVESEESNDADNEQDIECIEETQTEYDDLPDLVEEPVAPAESPSETSDDTDIAPPSKRARRGRGRGRGRSHT